MKMVLISIILLTAVMLFRHGWKHERKWTLRIIGAASAIVATAYLLSLLAYYTNQGSIL